MNKVLCECLEADKCILDISMDEYDQIREKHPSGTYICIPEHLPQGSQVLERTDKYVVYMDGD